MLINDIVDMVAFFNMVLCIIIIVWDLYFYFKVDEPEKWSKLLYVGIGGGWLIRYILYFISSPGLDRATVNVPLLILVTFTLCGFSVGSIIRVQRICGFRCLLNDIKSFFGRVKKWILTPLNYFSKH
jgi:hypothetical protein